MSPIDANVFFSYLKDNPKKALAESESGVGW